MESNIPQQQNVFSQNQPQHLPNATAVLVLGIVSIVTCFCYGVIPLTCGIIAIVLAKKDLALYTSMPGVYTESSYKNVKAGKTCAIVGISLGAVYLVAIIAYFIFMGSLIFSNTNLFR